MLVFLFTWQVRHQSAVKSTSTGLPAARACATASGLQRCQSMPSADSFSEPVASVSGNRLRASPILFPARKRSRRRAKSKR